jgi:hypothetical protein
LATNIPQQDVVAGFPRQHWLEITVVVYRMEFPQPPKAAVRFSHFSIIPQALHVPVVLISVFRESTTPRIAIDLLCIRCLRARRSGISVAKSGGTVKQLQVVLAICVCAYVLAASTSVRATDQAATVRATPAILSGYCGLTATTGPGAFVLYGIGQVVTSDCGGTNGQDGLPIPSAGRLKNLRVADLGSGGETISMMVNGASSTISCAIDIDTKTCNDTVHIANVSAGDLVAVEVSLATGQYASQLRVTMEKQERRGTKGGRCRITGISAKRSGSFRRCALGGLHDRKS